MADSIVKFSDRQIRPPRGGWHFPLPGGVLIEKHNETGVLEELKRWRQNNGSFVSDLDLEREVWTYYCSREPKRCRVPGQENPDIVPPRVSMVPIEVTPELQGPPIWTFLNTIAVQWTPALHDYFLHTVDMISAILVCPICKQEWQKIVREKPPTELNSALAVCQWVNQRHNEVNARIGKRAYPYARMVSEFGAPLT